MERELDLTTASREVLLAIIAKLQQRIETLEGKAKPGGPRGMPGLKPKADRKPAQPRGPRRPRRHGFSRQRMTPTRRVEHALDSGVRRRIGGRLGAADPGGHRHPAVPAQVTEHVFIARICPLCEQRRTPRADLAGVALGKQPVSLIAALREEARLPYRTIQWYLQTVHQLSLSVGTVGVIHRVARQAQGELGSIRERIRGSPVVHADETGWRENGVNGYVWTFSTPTERYFLRRGRNKEVVDEALGEDFAGALVSDFYAAYHHYDGPKQRCWAHLLREIHDLRALYSRDKQLAQWADAVHRIYRQATAFSHTSGKQRRAAQLALEKRLLALCRPCLDDPLAVQGKLCRRIDKHLKELFVFVAEPEVPPDNNAAERSLRPLVISRKISGGTRSNQGTDAKMALASLFGTWRAQGQNPLTACRQLLIPLKSWSSVGGPSCARRMSQVKPEFPWAGPSSRFRPSRQCRCRSLRPFPPGPPAP